MRRIAIRGTVCGLVLAAAGITYGSDFDALLEDLTFPDVDTVKVEAPVPNAPALQPAVGQGFFMPAPAGVPATTVAAPIVALAKPIQAPVSLEEGAAPVEAAGEVNFDAVFVAQQQDEAEAALTPVEVEAPTPVPEAAAADAVADAAPSPSDSEAAPEPIAEAIPGEPIPQPIIAPMTHPGGTIADCASCNSGCNTGCDQGMICMPHDKVNLPQSTLRQYFRSNKCYTHVWDGYRQCCGADHAHLMGDTGYRPSGKGLFGVEKNCNNCDACDR